MGEEEQFDYSDDESDMQDNDSVEEADASVGEANDSEYDIASVSYVSDEDGSFTAQETQPSGRRRSQYQVMNESTLQERQKSLVEQVTGILGVSPEDAARLLRHYKWDYARLNDAWWTDTEDVKRKVGLIDTEACTSAPKRKNAKAQCSICFEDFRRPQMHSAGCGHLFCVDCWKGYISQAIKSGHPALELRCPHPECKIAVPGAVFQEVCTEEESKRYESLSLESFVVDSSKLTFCPGVNCRNAVESHRDLDGEAMDVYCPCGAVFCFTCKEEAHRPVECETVKKWLIKNSAESENLNWIIANTKPCPQCKRPIEKNQGCMHMTCSQCRHQFCWLCLQDWKTHGEGTGGYYACNRYNRAVTLGEFDEDEQKRQHAKYALERYMHYYERWTENDRAKKDAAKKEKAIQLTDLELLSQQYSIPTSDMKYITDACLQVIDCRRILKWTYAYGFYHFDESVERSVPSTALAQQKEFFEFNQGQAEGHLDRLHGMIEHQLPEFKADPPHAYKAPGKQVVPKTVADFLDFRVRLLGATELVKTHFHRLVEELEKGMENMLLAYNEPVAGPSQPEPAPEDVPEQSKTKTKRSKAKGRGKGVASTVRTRAATRSPERQGNIGIAVGEEDSGLWQCHRCTFVNSDRNAEDCEICGAFRER